MLKKGRTLRPSSSSSHRKALLLDYEGRGGGSASRVMWGRKYPILLVLAVRKTASALPTEKGKRVGAPLRGKS